MNRLRLLSVDKVGRRVIRRALAPCHASAVVQVARVPAGLASNVYTMGAQDKVVQIILRHSKPHVTRERYINVFDRTEPEAVEKVQTRIEELREASQLLYLKFGDGFDYQ